MKRFAGFIITYRRPCILLKTIATVLSQTFPPEKLWVVDNSEDDLTRLAVEGLNEPKIFYYKVGSNSGPANAVNIAFDLIQKEGFKWVFWGDDDDPPPSLDTFERLFDCLNNQPEKECVGQLGVVGHRFNKKQGKIEVTPTNVLLNSDYVNVDTISGGMCKIIRASLIEIGVRIEPKLFFGFEELDFDLQVKKLGFISLVPSDIFLEQRKKKGRKEYVYRKLQSKESLWRQYYSTRNLLFLLKKHRLYLALIVTLFRKMIKMIIEFRKGISYGTANFFYTGMGIWHWMIGKYGKRF